MWILIILVCGLTGLAAYRWHADREEQDHYQAIASEMALFLEDMFYQTYPNWRYTNSIHCFGFARRQWFLVGEWEVHLEAVGDETVSANAQTVSKWALLLRNKVYSRERFAIEPSFVAVRRREECQRDLSSH